MSDTVVGNNDYGPSFWYPGTGTNQQGSVFTCPVRGRLHRLGGCLTTFGGASGSAILCVWDGATGNLIGQTAEFAVPVGSWAWFEMDTIAPPLVSAGQTVIVGVYWTYMGTDNLVGLRVESSGLARYKSAGGGGPVNFYSHTDYPNITVDCYGLISPGATVKVRRGGAWVSAPAKVRRSGAWVDATSVKVRRGGAWHDA